jgi:peptide deformylase
MKTLADLLLLGDPRLYETCEPVLQSELPMVAHWVAYMDNVMQEIRAKYNFGRAIAAPQLGIMKRLIYMNIDKPVVFINLGRLYELPQFACEGKSASIVNHQIPRYELACARMEGGWRIIRIDAA